MSLATFGAAVVGSLAFSLAFAAIVAVTRRWERKTGRRFYP